MFMPVLEIKVEEYFFSCVINLLNNKTIILLNLAEYRLILANSAYGSLRPRQAIFRAISQDNNIIVNFFCFT